MMTTFTTFLMAHQPVVKLGILLTVRKIVRKTVRKTARKTARKRGVKTTRVRTRAAVINANFLPVKR